MHSIAMHAPSIRAPNARSLKAHVPKRRAPKTQQRQHSVMQKAGIYARAAGEVVAETLWPARCAVCGKLGNVLCESCRSALPYIDQWRACPRCGAPYGMYQCTECNTFNLQSLNRQHLAFAGCVSAVAFTAETARIARTRKDLGDRGLALPMAFAIACAVPPAWMESLQVTYVPSTQRALRERGFCHGKDLAEEVARLLHLPCRGLLAVRKTTDQRQLGRRQRASNTQGQFHVQTEAGRLTGAHILLVDDVYTTGSTVQAASEALQQAGVTCVYVATFARV